MSNEEVVKRLSQLVTTQEIQAKKLEAAIANGKKRNLERRTLGFYEGKLKELSKLWEIFDDTDTQVQELEEKCGPTNKFPYIIDNRYAKVSEKYQDYVAELLDGVQAKTPRPQQEITTPPTTPPTTVQTLQTTPIPRISLPNFNGEYEGWRSFHDLFSSVVHNNEALQPVQKLHYLKGCLSGDAERLLRHIPVTNNDYEPAWDKLKQRYENKRVLINMQLKRLINPAQVTTESTKTLRMLQDTTEECLHQLKALGVATENWDIMLIHILTKGLHPTTFKLWEEELGESTELPTLKQFNNFLQTRARVLEAIASTINEKEPNLQYKERMPKQQVAKTYHALTKKSQESKTCPACKQNHYIISCKSFIDMNSSSRAECIAKSGRCFNCFSSQHTVKQCKNVNKCKTCARKHHTMLHASRPNINSTANSNTNTEVINEIQPTTQAFFSRKAREATLATMRVVTQDINNKETVLRCLVDPGSQASFITYTAFKGLCLKGTPAKVNISGLNQIDTACSNILTEIDIRSFQDKTQTLKVDCLVIPRITDTLPFKTFEPCSQWTHLTGLPLADPTYWKAGLIDMLIGVDTFADMVLNEIVKGPKDAPIGINTIFGWIILGKGTRQNRVESFFTTTIMEELNKNLIRFWEQEKVPDIKAQDPADEQCEQQFLKTHQRLDNGQYQVRLPFISTPSFGASKSLAVKRFEHLQRKFIQNHKLKEEYSQCLDEYKTLKHMTMVNENTAKHQEHYFIPHHAVFKNSTTTKLRVVFDASAKTSNGKSLNEQLHTGPTLQPKLFATLLKWRKYRVAITADIEKMYRMIRIHPDDQRFQRIIWTNSKGNISEYELQTVTFGTASAPYLAIRTLLQLAQDEHQNWPLAAAAAKTDFYVDDLLTGADTVKEAKQLQFQFINMLKTGHFNLRKWASNFKELLTDLPIEQVETKEFLQLDEHETIRTLGIQWIPKLDIFTFKFREPTGISTITKRKLLSEISSVYDPHGWISPVTITAKILMQQLWIDGYSWDVVLNETLKEKWIKYKQNLHQLETLKISRWVGFTTQAKNVQLRGFCDASMRAYAAVIYLRVEHQDGTTTAHLLTAKTRVTPVKPITIPRLELCGATLVAKLLHTTMQNMNFKTIPVFAWTDSMITLQWIQSNPRRWTTYVANRTSEIHGYVNPERWRHIPTQDNPADMASRGIDAKDLGKNQLWWHGPNWLIQSEDKWPTAQKHTNITTVEERKKIIAMSTTVSVDPFWEKYSSFNKLKRVLATVQRFVHNIKKGNKRKIGPFTEEDLTMASNTIFKHIQRVSFPEEYRNLQIIKRLHKQSKLVTLNPFLDEQGLIRVGGRLENANISYTQKHPIILPPNHVITRLLIIEIHKNTLHGGKALVVNTSRQQYWILNAQKLIAKCINQCHTCIRYRKQIRSQLMGNLPASRININPPFFNVGIDYAGPINLKQSNLRNTRVYKGYFCLFVCMATKAIHLELTSDLTSAAFLAALRRFIARRGTCKNIFSDCGTNFKGAESILNKELKETIKTVTEVAAKQVLQQYSIQWHFNPPLAPHFGGIWESGVKAVKHHLRRIIGKTILTYEEYSTLLCQVEACLNSRPLCPLDNTIDSLEVLTPGHFLIGRPLNAIPEPNLTEKQTPPLRRWKHIQYMAQQFWAKWMKEYLNTLQQRYKWRQRTPNFKIGDIVLVKAENTSPTYWPLGRVEKIFQGKDNLVRVVEVKTATNILVRPIEKLCLLTSNEEEKD